MTRVRQSCTFSTNSRNTKCHKPRPTPTLKDLCCASITKRSCLVRVQRLRRIADSSALPVARVPSSSSSLPADRFGGCYQVPHWALPPLKTMSLMANRTFDTILNHFSFLHGPTFKLIDTAACLAFAICTVGGVRSGKHKYDYLLDRVDAISNGNSAGGDLPLDGPVPPGNTWESMYRSNFIRGGPDDEAVAHVAKWENGHIVRVEKTNMLVKVS